MRNGTGFVLPIAFSWKVARNGYRWIDSKGKRFLCAVDALQPDWHNLFDRYERTYLPIGERTGLFREFGELKPTEPDILAFANRFGLLEAVDDVELPSKSGPVPVHGDSLQLWQDEIGVFKFAIALWDLLTAGKRQALADFQAKANSQELLLAAGRSSHLHDADPAMLALSAIQRIADSRLQEHVATRLLFQGNPPRPGISLMPRNLLGALWLQFSAAVGALKAFNRCRQCGAPFELSRDPQTGKRRDARFCSARCRVGHYRGRKEQARRLNSTGMSAQQIARELNTRAGTVRGWLKGAERGGPLR
jgi:hypothetical protein